MNPDTSPATAPGILSPAGARKGHARRILWNTGILAITALVVRGMGMGMMIVLARYLGAEGYGTYQRAESFVFLFSILASLGLDMILSREVARRSPDAPEYLAGVVTLKLILSPACLVLILGLAFARGYQGTFLWGICCYGMVMMLSAVGESVDAVFQGLGNMQNIAIANLINQLVFVVLGGVCVFLHRDLRWILACLAIAAGVRLVVSLSLLRRLHIPRLRPRPATLGYLLRQAIPIAVASSFVVVYHQLDTVLLGELKGNTQVGWYRASAKFMLFFTVLRDSFLVAIYPAFSAVSAADRGRMGALVTRAVRYQLIAAFFFVICFVLLPQVAPALLGQNFEGTKAVLPIMAWVLVPQTISITMGRVLVATGNQQRCAIATGLALLLNAALNLTLIPRFAYMGAAAAGAISELAVALMNVYFVQRYVSRTRILRAVLKPAIAAVLAGLVLYRLPGLGLIPALVLTGVLYVGLLFAVRTFSAAELGQLWSALRAAWARLSNGGEEPKATPACPPEQRT